MCFQGSSENACTHLMSQRSAKGWYVQKKMMIRNAFACLAIEIVCRMNWSGQSLCLCCFSTFWTSMYGWHRTLWISLSLLFLRRLINFLTRSSLETFCYASWWNVGIFQKCIRIHWRRQLIILILLWQSLYCQNWGICKLRSYLTSFFWGVILLSFLFIDECWICCLPCLLWFCLLDVIQPILHKCTN